MRAILTYHSVDSSGSAISVSEEQFRAHVRFLASGRVSVVPLAELATHTAKEDAVALTFDDGFLSFSTVASPLLSSTGLPATLFVVSDHVGGNNLWKGSSAPSIPVLPLMGWDRLRAAVQQGFEVGAHTRRHPDLTSLSPQQLDDELSGCADKIASELGGRPARLAYPYGAVNAAVASMARRVFAQSFTTELRLLGSSEDPALLPRLDAYYFRQPGQLEAWGSPSFRRRLWVRAQGRRVRSIVAVAGLVR